MNRGALEKRGAMNETQADIPKCSFCGVSATDLPPHGGMIQSEKHPDVWICESCIRGSYQLLQEDERKISK